MPYHSVICFVSQSITHYNTLWYTITYYNSTYLRFFTCWHDLARYIYYLHTQWKLYNLCYKFETGLHTTLLYVFFHSIQHVIIRYDILYHVTIQIIYVFSFIYTTCHHIYNICITTETIHHLLYVRTLLSWHIVIPFISQYIACYSTLCYNISYYTSTHLCIFILFALPDTLSVIFT